MTPNPLKCQGKTFTLPHNCVYSPSIDAAPPLLLFSSLVQCERLREYIQCSMRRTAILKNNSTAEKRREEEAFALKSIAHYCFVEIKNNCAPQPPQPPKPPQPP